MKVLSLKLKNYRNFDNELFKPSDGINIIYGDNAQGKTNLIESIWLFTGGRSFRGSKDADLVKFNNDFAELKMDFFSEERNQEALIRIINKKRKISINKIEKNSPSSLIGTFCAVVFSPNHLSLVKDGPSDRRKFINTALCQLKPNYCAALLRYNHVLTQRNSLLKDIKYHKELLETLDVWEENLSNYGAIIIKERVKYIQLLQNKAKTFYRGISDDKESFSVLYKPNVIKYDIIEDDEIAVSFLDELKRHRKDDLMLGYTSIGPHRDDLSFNINSLNAKSFGSQGQQRSLVLSLKLAEASILKEQTNQMPVILLDDVMSELDSKRQKYLIDSIKEWQVFLTCCDPANIINLNGPKKFEIKNDKIVSL